MTKLQKDASINNIAKYFRDELIDPYSGEPIPNNVVEEIKEIFANKNFRKKIFRGQEYSKVFTQILRDYRIKIIEDIISNN